MADCGPVAHAASKLERVPVHLCKGWLQMPVADLSRSVPPLEPLSFSSVRNLDNGRCRRLAPFAVSSRSREMQNPNRRETVTGQHLQRKAVYPYAVLEDHATKPPAVTRCSMMLA